MKEVEISDEEYLEILMKAGENREWINANYEKLSEKYPNEYICVRDKKVINRGEELKELLIKEGIAPDVVCEYIVPHGTAMLL